uniref:Uncharacterized protein n=1 Tax=Haptolina brevifila TaxID=156173 RepID=A0A7S2N3L7_9EUKA|mmetsp:Transcript_65872/g.130585  ORF Transcript_65872/g.130585 Transcript_65872/m.130585 type:complete len:184 (+) Transcript_65872:72-623(+)
MNAFQLEQQEIANAPKPIALAGDGRPLDLVVQERNERYFREARGSALSEAVAMNEAVRKQEELEAFHQSRVVAPLPARLATVGPLFGGASSAKPATKKPTVPSFLQKKVASAAAAPSEKTTAGTSAAAQPPEADPAPNKRSVPPTDTSTGDGDVKRSKPDTATASALTGLVDYGDSDDDDESG